MHSRLLVNGRTLLPMPGVVIAFALAMILVALGVEMAQGASPTQATSGDAVYFQSTSRGSSDIWFVIPGQKPQRAAFSSRGSDDKDPSVSPDGRFLAFSSKRGGDYEIYVVDLQAGSRARPRRITTNTSADTNPRWSPDSRNIVYVTNRYNVSEIMVIPATGCKRRQRRCDTRITKNRFQDINPAWSPDGRTIAFSSKRSRDRGLQIYTMTPTGRSIKRLTNVSANSISPSWSANGRSIAFVSKRRTNRDRTNAIYTMTSTGRNQRKITSGRSNDQYPVWSPDGKSITFTSVGRRSSIVSSVGANGGRTTRLMASRARVGAVAWGKSISAPVVAISKPPSATPVPTSTPKPKPTSTPIPPTATPTPIPPTATPLPPTATAVPVVATAIPASGGTFTPDQQSAVVGFTVRLQENDPDSAWESLAGGAFGVEIGDASTGADQFHTAAVGLSYVTEATLTGPLIGGGNSGTESTYEILENGAGKFRIELDDMPIFSSNVDSIEIEPLTIGIREILTGTNTNYRQYGPGDVRLGTIEISALRGQDSSEAYQWWLDVSQGQNVLKNLSVISLKRDGSDGRRWNFSGCIPEIEHPFGGFSPESNIGIETLTIGCGRVELAGNGRQDVTGWLNDTMQGREWKRTVAVKEIEKDGSDGRTYTYMDAFPVQYVFPSFSASGTGNLTEELTFKPIRLELN